MAAALRVLVCHSLALLLALRLATLSFRVTFGFDFILLRGILGHHALELRPKRLNRRELVSDLESLSKSLLTLGSLIRMVIERLTAMTASSERFNLLMLESTCSKLYGTGNVSLQLRDCVGSNVLTIAISPIKASRCCSKYVFSLVPVADVGRWFDDIVSVGRVDLEFGLVASNVGAVSVAGLWWGRRTVPILTWKL
jgi:hypothetical protein